MQIANTDPNGAGVTPSCSAGVAALDDLMSAAQKPVHKGTNVIMLVDDEIQFVDAIYRGLKRKAFLVDVFHSSATAEEAFRNNPHRFGLVVTDYNMPGSNGLELIRKIRQIQAQVPTVLISAYLTNEVRAMAQKIVIQVILEKPFPLEYLLLAVSRYVTGDPPDAESV